MKSKSLFKYIGLSITLIIGSCIEEQNVQIKDNIPFVVSASFADVKTASWGGFTWWTEGDAIAVFHAENGSSDFVPDGEFVLDGNDYTRFMGNVDSRLFDSEMMYDWIALYPYCDADDLKLSIGGLEPQRQIGINDMQHISGENLPLYGCIENVPFSEMPRFQMHHLSSLIEVRVRNDLQDDITIDSIAITAPVNLVGEFEVNTISKDISVRDGVNASRKAELKIEGATVPPRSEASFYLAVRPFTLPAESALYITVNDYERKVSIDKSLDFKAGVIKTVNFVFDEDAINSSYPMPILKWGVTKDEVRAIYGNGTDALESDENTLIFKDKKGTYLHSYTFDKNGLTASCMIAENKAVSSVMKEWIGDYDYLQSGDGMDIYLSEDGQTLMTESIMGNQNVMAWGAVENRGELNGHEYVDLGLSVMWATCNVGAESPEEYGGYYAWGETCERDGKDYIREKYELRIKYTYPEGNWIWVGKDVGSNIGGTQYDAAAVQWGDGWRMPTRAEMMELISQCVWKEEVQNGIEGVRVESVNGESIFFPYGGRYYASSDGSKSKLRSAGARFYLWTDTVVPFTGASFDAYNLTGFDEENGAEVEDSYRWSGLNVRAVIDSK